jgi:hypothetical protein
VERHVIWAVNAAYYDMLAVSIASFRRHHGAGGWRLHVLDVGLGPDQAAALAADGIDVPLYPAHHLETIPGLTYPATYARLRMPADFTRGDDLLLYLDADTLVLHPVEDAAAAFVASGLPFGLAIESDDTPWPPPRMRDGWRGGQIPAYFADRDRWAGEPVMNTGVMFARGPAAADASRACLAAYPHVVRDALWAEQSVLDAVILDAGVPWWPVPRHVHCLAAEVRLLADGPIYERGARYEGHPVVVRHFCSGDAKRAYRERLLDGARQFYATAGAVPAQVTDLGPVSQPA